MLFAVAAGGARIIPLRPSAGAALRGSLVVGGDGQAYLVLDVPQPPPGKAYEAWVIRDGSPLRAGVAPIRAGVVTVRLETALRPGDVTAVTLEIAAGVDRPTTDPLLVGPA